MNCRECHDKLSLYLDGQLTQEETLRVEEALERCPECVEELAILRELVEELGAEEEIPVPTALLQDLKDAFRLEVAAEKKQAPTQSISIMGHLGNWRVAASIGALLFASWAVFMDQQSKMAPEKAAYTTLAEGRAPARTGGEFAAAPSTNQDLAPSSDEKIKDSDSINGGASDLQEMAKRAEVKTNKSKSPSPELEIKKKALAGSISEDKKQEDELGLDEENEEKGDQDASSLATLKHEYDQLVRELRADGEDDFAPEPLESGVLAALKTRKVQREERSRHGFDQEKKSKSGGTQPVPEGDVRKKIKPRKRQLAGRVPSKGWSKKSDTKAPTIAFFALGESAMKDITTAAKENGLQFSMTAVESLAKDKSATDLGNLVTFEVDESQRESLLKKLRSTDGLRLQLFGQTPVAKRAPENTQPPAKGASPEVGTSSPKKSNGLTGSPNSKGDTGSKSNPKQKRSASKSRSPELKPSAPRFRISFIVLNR